MQRTKSDKLCEAWVKRRIRDTSQLPRRFAYLWMGMTTPRVRSRWNPCRKSQHVELPQSDDMGQRQKVIL